jgi:HlyD family secretion protein
MNKMNFRALGVPAGLLLAVSVLLFQTGCAEKELYNGRLEADTIRLSAQTTGVVTFLHAEEGDKVQPRHILAVINKEKLQAQLKQVQADLNYNRDLLRKTQALLNAGAATRQRRNELRTKVSVLTAQKKGIELQLRDAVIRAPIRGVVLTKYVNKGEFVSPGTLIAEVADLTRLKALIYLPLAELAKIKIGQNVNVFIDGIQKPISGTITWVAAEAEFTPKTILTKETRTTLVYAVKVKVNNSDGRLKIGMPVDVQLVAK